MFETDRIKLVEVLPVERAREGVASRMHRRWSEAFKATVAAECLLPGAKVTAIAARVGIDRAQLYQWRTAAIRKGLIKLDQAAVKPLEDSVPKAPQREKAAVKRVQSKAVIEICVGDSVLRVGSDVEEAHLQRVIKAIKGA